MTIEKPNKIIIRTMATRIVQLESELQSALINLKRFKIDHLAAQKRIEALEAARDRANNITTIAVPSVAPTENEYSVGDERPQKKKWSTT
jgi:hypothetical protein